MKISFKNKSILVTGGAGGIGFETARMFAKAGGNATIIDLNQEKLDSAKKELEKFGTKILALKCDVSKEECKISHWENSWTIWKIRYCL